MKRSTLIAMLAVCRFACGCGESFDPPAGSSDAPAPNIAAASLRSLYRGQSVLLQQELIVGGRVVSNDAAGNFYRTLTIDDGTGALELSIAEYNLHALYPPGCELTVSLQGCALGERNGVLQIGLPPETYDSHPTDYIASRVLLDRMIHRTGRVLAVEPATCTVARLDETMCGRPIRIEGLEPLPDTGSDEPQTWAGYRLFTDAAGGLAVVYTSSYARFAARQIPQERCTLTGLLEYGSVPGYGKRFILRMRDENDCSIP